MADIFRSALGIFGGTKSDSDFVGQRVDLGSVQLRVKRLIAEGAYGFVFIAQDVSTGKDYALKRLMAGDEAANKAIIQEICFMKRLRGHPNIVQFINAASIGAEEADHGMAEFLILTELCTGGQFIKWFNGRQGKLIPSNQVLRIFHQISRAVSHMHKQNPPIIHRDLKIENILLSSRGQIKLCDFGSATTKSLFPTESWSSVERSLVEDEIQRNTTPMYRGPEMVDLYTNYQITTKCDVWALGCLLYMLCYMEHPFDDGAKLRILNAKFTLPEFDKEYGVFHDLIHKMLQVDPVKRPDISEIVTDIEAIALCKYVELKGSIFEGEESLVSSGISQDTQDSPVAGNAVFGGVVKGAGSFFSNIKDMSNKVVQSVAGYVKSDLDVSYITSRVIVMPIPGEGIESTYKNSVDDVQIFLDTKHTSRFAIVNLSQRPSKLKGKVFDCDWSPKRAPPLEKIFLICKKIVAWLKIDKKNVVVIQCQDGKLTSGLLVTSLFLFCHLFMSPECAFEMFNIRRQNMSTKSVPNPSQKHYFNYVTELMNDPDVKPHKCYLTINSMAMEPVPLFNKARKGCRPFIEIYNGDKRVFTTAREIEKLREYTVSDQQIEFDLRVEIQGDVTICVYHGRSTLGGKVQGKLTSIPMFQVQFHTGFVGKISKKMVFIKEDIDIVDSSNLNRFAENFNLTLNINVNEHHCSDVKCAWDSNQNEKATRQLLFTTSEEYLQCQEDFVLGDDREMCYREQFELDRKTRKNKLGQRSNGATTDKQTVENKTSEDDKTGSFLKNLNWEEEGRLEEESGSDDDSDVDWEALRHPSKPGDSAPENKKGASIDFFTESEGMRRTVKEEVVDLFHLKEQDDKEADLLGLGLDDAQEPLQSNATEADLPSPKSRKDTRHSSLGDEQLHADFDLFNLSKEHSKEDSDVGLLGEAVHSSGMKRNKSADDILIHSPSDQSVTDDYFFGRLNKPSDNVPAANSTSANSFDLFGPAKTKDVDLFGDFNVPASSSSSNASILIPQANVSKNQNNFGNPKESTVTNDPFADLGGLASKNGFGKFGSNTPPKGSGGDISSFAKTTSSSKQQTPTKGLQDGSQSWGTPAQTKPAQKPNYAPSYSPTAGSVFGTYGLKDSYVHKQVKKDEFGDILNSQGFKPTAGNEPNTMNSLRKQVDVEDDPVKAKVQSWSEGKGKNIRALLCSLDTVLWEGEERWEKVGMHELVHAGQVKKCYKRAVLSVHPDKRIGKPEEHLARAIFIQLNESWAAFEESGSKSLY